ncbi:MAG: DegT/DnrJ/EryC1/StrS family aminotransferase [Endomicrobiales bacterium]
MKRSKENFLVFGSPLIGQEEIDEVVATLRSGWLGTGPRVRRFEQLFGAYKGSRFAVALHSCTAALHLSLLAAGLRPGDEVIVPSLTFAATANAVIHAGGKPVFADCERGSMNIDPADIERKITERTRALLPVHFAGRACDMDRIMDLAHQLDLKVIEDCAHAIETEYRGQKAGTFGEAGCFSFYATKNIATGEGGMVITENAELAARVRSLGLHGLSADAWDRFGGRGYKHYQVVHAGFKYNMMDLQAALGIHQLARIERCWQRRKEIWDRYNEAFRDLPVFLPAPPEPGTRHALHLYTLLLDTDRLPVSRDEFLSRMTGAGVGVGVHYVALHLHPYYREALDCKPGDCPNAEWISGRTVSLPLSPKLTEEDVADVIAATRSILEEK